MKKCTKCNVEQSFTEFHKDKAKKDGLYGKCKTCKAKYKVWSDMMRRCHNTKHKSYKNYGYRGITVCQEWQTYAGMELWIEKHWIKGLQIDRMDNDKGYNPENCAFVSRSENNLNKRVSGSVPYRGVYFNKAAQKYQAKVKINGKSKYIGIFITPIDAAVAFDDYIMKNNLPNQLNFREN